MTLYPLKRSLDIGLGVSSNPFEEPFTHYLGTACGEPGDLAVLDQEL